MPALADTIAGVCAVSIRLRRSGEGPIIVVGRHVLALTAYAAGLATTPFLLVVLAFSEWCDNCDGTQDVSTVGWITGGLVGAAIGLGLVLTGLVLATGWTLARRRIVVATVGLGVVGTGLGYGWLVLADLATGSDDLHGGILVATLPVVLVLAHVLLVVVAAWASEGDA